MNEQKFIADCLKKAAVAYFEEAARFNDKAFSKASIEQGDRANALANQIYDKLKRVEENWEENPKDLS